MKKGFYLSIIFMLMGIMARGATVQRIEAETFDEASGAKAETNASLSDGGNVGYVKNGTWIKFAGVVFDAFYTQFNVDANAYDGGNVEFRLDAVDGTLIATAEVPAGTTYGAPVFAAITSTTGTHDLYLVFTSAATGWLFNLDYFEVVTELPTTLSDEAATVNWAFDQGTADQAASYLHDGFWKPESVTVAANLSYNGTETGAENGVTFSKFAPGQKNNSVTADDVVSFNVTPVTGLTFLPTSVSFNCERFGTGGGLIDVVWKDAAGVSTSLQTGIKPDRKNDDSYPDATYDVNLDVSAMGIAATEGTSSLEVYIYAFDPGKNVGIANIKIDGLLSGTVVALPQYTLTTGANPAEGGTVESDKADVVDEGTKVSLTGVPNFGYAFTEWLDKDGNSVSTENPLDVTVMSDTALTAAFTAVDTYTLNVLLEGGANDYMVDATPNDNNWMYEAGDTVTLTARENSVLTFGGWSTGATETSIEVIMSGNNDVTATYTSDGDMIAGWDFFKSANADVAAPFASANNDTAMLSFVNSAGVASGWLDFSHDQKGDNDGWGNPKKYCAINWKGSDPAPTAETGYHMMASFNATGFTNIQAQAEIAGTVDHYVVQNCEYSLDGTSWTTIGTFDLSTEDAWVQNKFALGEDANNAPIVYVRWIPDYTSTFSDHAWTNDGTSYREMYITGTAVKDSSYQAMKVSGGKPVIDGNIDEFWNKVAMVPIAKVPVNDNITEPNPDPSDFSAEFGLIWDETGIYALIKVTDDKIVIEDDYDTNNATPADQWWTDDHINLLFSSDLLNESFNQWEFAWQAGIDQEEKLSSDDWLNPAKIDINLVKSAWHNEGDVWTLETWISWDAFTDFTGDITEGMDIFMEARARDDDDGGTWESMFQWNTTDYGVEGTGVGLGKVNLSAATVEVPLAKQVAYIQKAGKTNAEDASTTDNDPIIRMLQADGNFEVTVLETDGNGSDLDLSGYDLAIAQETFGSGDGIWTSAGPLGIENLSIPVIYNKTWALRNGKAITDDGSAAVTSTSSVFITVDEASQSNPMYSGITFDGTRLRLYNEPANDDGSEGTGSIDVLNGLSGIDGTLLASVDSVKDAAGAIVINDIPAGSVLGTEDTLGVRMVALSFKYGSIIRGDGANITSEALTIWRNAAYLLTGLTPPASLYVNEDYVPYVAPKQIAYIQKAGFAPAEGASAIDNDVIIRMLKSDSSFELTVIETDGNGTDLDLTGYDVAIAQETFGSGDGIWTPTGPLGLRNLSIPVVYNKTWALRGGKAVTDADAAISSSAQLFVTIDPAAQSNPLFSGITFAGNDVTLFRELSSGETGNAIDALVNIDLSATGTLLATVPEVSNADQSIVINHIPAGTQFGEDAADVSAVDMIAFAQNYGAISRGDGANMSSEALTMWRNAVYILSGLTPPAELYVNEAYTPVAVDDVQETHSIVVYPNPVVDNLTVKGVKAGASITIYAANGQLIAREQANADQHTLSVGNLQNGVYILKIDANGTSVITKFIK